MANLSPLFTWRSAICESDLAPTVRHVALTLSLHMNERGGSAFPGHRLLADETGLARETVSKALKRLEEVGWLEVVRPSRQGRGMRTEYVAMVPESVIEAHTESVTDDHASPERVIVSREKGDPARPEDVSEDVRDLLPTVVDLGARRRDDVWDTLAELFGEPTTESNRKLRGRVVRSLKQAGATGEQIRLRCAAWPHHFDATLTETALEKHWDRLARPPARLPAGALGQWQAEQERALRAARAAELDAESRGLPR